MAPSGRAWWPGGRKARNAASPSPAALRRRRRAARRPPVPLPATSRPTWSCRDRWIRHRAQPATRGARRVVVCTRVISSTVARAAGAASPRRRCRLRRRAAWAMPACTASSRAGRSGCAAGSVVGGVVCATSSDLRRAPACGDGRQSRRRTVPGVFRRNGSAGPRRDPAVTLARRHVAPELSHPPLAGRLGASGRSAPTPTSPASRWGRMLLRARP